ncbi:hypothetical protein BMS3Bbin14_00449 [bacterium BMS3Bbin14]|nr:hypothetical protein BMS3Abin13_00186 [bacterium BMS3Abin13]GBE51991.1 hypothetical protein BMS3Bbin14_00449 [bacterium BMS3Bbin14]
MSDLQKYIAKRKVKDQEFAENYGIAQSSTPCDQLPPLRFATCQSIA